MQAYFKSTILGNTKIRNMNRIFPNFSWDIFSHIMHVDQIVCDQKYWMDYNTAFQF